MKITLGCSNLRINFGIVDLRKYIINRAKLDISDIFHVDLLKVLKIKNQCESSAGTQPSVHLFVIGVRP